MGSLLATVQQPQCGSFGRRIFSLFVSKQPQQRLLQPEGIGVVCGLARRRQAIEKGHQPGFEILKFFGRKGCRQRGRPQIFVCV